MERVSAWLAGAFLLASVGCSTKVSLQPALSDQPLPPDHGIVIIGLENDVPYERLIINGAQNIELDYAVMAKAEPFLVFYLKEGKYEYDRVWFSSYSYLPFKNRVSKNAWSFEVKRQQINYIGNVVLSKSDANRFYSRIRNNAAQALSHLESKHLTKLQRYPLVNALAPKDPFLEQASKMKGYVHE